MKKRITYFILVIAVIIAGLLSRHYSFIPLFIGDILWATMVYFIARFLFTSKSLMYSAIAALIFSYSIEFSQLYQALWINNLRHTLLGKLILGQGFLWSDLLCYTVGVGIGLAVDKFKTKTK